MIDSDPYRPPDITEGIEDEVQRLHVRQFLGPISLLLTILIVWVPNLVLIAGLSRSHVDSAIGVVIVILYGVAVALALRALRIGGTMNLLAAPFAIIAQISLFVFLIAMLF